MKLIIRDIFPPDCIHLEIFKILHWIIDILSMEKPIDLQKDKYNELLLGKNLIQLISNCWKVINHIWCFQGITTEVILLISNSLLTNIFLLSRRRCSIDVYLYVAKNRSHIWFKIFAKKIKISFSTLWCGKNRETYSLPLPSYHSFLINWTAVKFNPILFSFQE